MPDDAATVVGSLEQSAPQLISHLSLAAPHATLATFAASAILKFISVGREIQSLQRTRQQELRDRLREQIRPTLRTVVDPEVGLRRAVMRFFVLAGRPNPELRRAAFNPLLAAFGDEIRLVAEDRRNDPAYRLALQDLTFVFLFIRPAVTREPAALEDALLQQFFGDDVATRDPHRLRTIVDAVRGGGFEQYDQTPDWYRSNLDGYLYWKLASHNSLRLATDAEAEIRRQFTAQVRAIYVDAVFGPDGIFEGALTTLTAFKEAKKAEATGEVDTQLDQVMRTIERAEAARIDERARVGLERRALTLDLAAAERDDDVDAIRRVRTELVALEEAWARREIDLEAELLDLGAKQRDLTWQREELDDA